jgi:serine/threonine protein kinase
MPEDTIYRNALPLASRLLEYRLESVLGAGAFGMTYLAWDTHLEKHVAMKEHLPTELAVRALDGSVVPVTTEHGYNYQWGLDRFILEARTLARFSHPNIVRVTRYFEANGTGYMVMDYEKGESLWQLLKRAPRPQESQLRAMLMPLLDGLEAVHETGFLHRDIKPSNVFIRENGVPVLLDFGAARQAIGGATKSLTSILTPGYAPLEQYSGDGHQGPWSDMYALAGVLYRAIVNENPPDAVSRLRSDVLPEKLAAVRGEVSDAFLDAAAWALALDENQRPRSVREWRRALLGETRIPALPAAAGLATTVRPDTTTVSLSQPEAAPPVEELPPAPRRRVSSPREPDRSYWTWAGVGLALLAAVALVVTWNNQHDKTILAPATRAAERALEKPKLRPKPAVPPGQQPQVAAAVPERPSRERGDRPGEESADDPLRRQAAQEFRGADTDGDGYLSQDEARRFPFISKEFQRVDVDGDGRISLQEFIQLRRWQAQQRVQKPGDSVP